MIRRRNSLFGLIVFLSICQASLAQITIFPDVERRTDESVRILKIEITDLFTIVDILYIPEEEDAWICVENPVLVSTLFRFKVSSLFVIKSYNRFVLILLCLRSGLVCSTISGIICSV